MMVDASETKVLVRLRPHRIEELLLGDRRIELAGGHLIDEILELFV
jgi:hypothetical protein